MADNKQDFHEETVKSSEEEHSSSPESTTTQSNSEVPMNEENLPAPLQPTAQSLKKKNWFKRLWSTKKGKVLITAAAILVVAGVLLAIPQTRYGILGTIIKKNVSFTVTDNITNRPVSQADVWLGSTHVFTDDKGTATFSSVPVNAYTLKVSKKYYKDTTSTYSVPIFASPQTQNVILQATGRPVTVKVTNSITHAALAKATLTVGGTSEVTDSKGEAVMVLPADKKTLQGWVRLDGYNTADVTVDESGSNAFSLTPAGSVFYLSKQTGVINVMKSNLDGTSPSVVVQGTGNELDDSTVLLAARDWRFMALSAQRDPKEAGQLYLVNAQSGALTTIDEGNASFQLVGWSDHKFIYIVTRNDVNVWTSKRQSLKSYDADTGKITVLDETTAAGTNTSDYQSEAIRTPYILANQVVYVKNWEFGSYTPTVTSQKPAIMSVNPDGSNKQRVKEFTMQHFVDVTAKLYEPQSIYFQVNIDGTYSYYEFEDNAVKSVANMDDTKFYNTTYPTYLISPSGQKTFWSDARDGKNTLLVGDANAKNGKTLASQSDFTAYGWYSDQYVLLSKNGSELYIASANDPLDTVQPIKITNYHKPQITFPGYGYGYGGNV